MMKLFSFLKEKVAQAKNMFLHASWKKKLLVVLILVGVSWFGFNTFSSQKQQPQYQTAQAEKGTLIVSVSASGQVSAANSTSVTTQVSGVVKTVYVHNGDTVKMGDKIAEIELDQAGQQKQQQAWASYLQAKTNLDSANANMFTLQSQMFTNWQTYMETAQSTAYQNGDGSPNSSARAATAFTVPQDDWLAAQEQYKNQQAVIAQAQIALNSTWLSYQQSSSTIVAPIGGAVDGLTLQEGTVLASSQSTSSNTSSSNSSSSSSSSSGNNQKVGSIKTSGHPVISVNLSEVDAPKVKIGDKATITLDAFSGKTFTGKLVSIDTTGTVSSGVTTYPVLIQLDTDATNIYSNMSATANIITDTKDDVVLVPNAAVQTQNDATTVRTLKNGTLTEVPVEIGLSNDTQTEIVSGIAEGDTVVTSIVTNQTSATATGSSPFGGLRGGFGGGGGGGNAVRVQR